MTSASTQHQQQLLNLYQDIHDELFWDNFLGTLKSILNAQSLSVFIRDKRHRLDQGSIYHIGGSKYWQDQYDSHFHIVDPLMSIPTERPTTLTELLGSQRLRKTEYFQKFMSPLDLTDSLGIDSILPYNHKFGIRVSKYSGEPPFKNSDKELLFFILPHVTSALRTRLELQHNKILSKSFQISLETLGIGVLTVDSNREIIDADRFAKKLLSQFCCVERGLKFRFHQASHNESFKNIMQKLMRDDAQFLTYRTICIPTADKIALTVTILKHPHPANNINHTSIFTILVIQHGKELTPNLDIISSVFNITSAEAALACKLASGLTPELVALERGVSINTIRSQIRSIFSKFNISKITDLVRILLRYSPPYNL